MKKIYPYLKDDNFLYEVDLQHLQKQYIKIILLDWNEKPLQEIQGIATSGSISVNGNSSVRRTCNLTMNVKDVSTGKITDANNLISINKKVFIEIGIENTTDKYTDYPILWYPQGTYVITSCSISSSLGQGTTLSAQFKDKMCLLNGECGGVITSAVTLDKYDTVNTATGEIYTSRPTISMIIRELVNHFGNEQLGKIIINDIDEKVKQVMKWTGSNPLYLATNGTEHKFTTSKAEALEFGIVQEFAYGQDVGFIYTDFTYPGELNANAGDNVCTILDKIKNTLGNYEYYYDKDGNFIFQEIKNYLNTTQATVDIKNITNNDYVIDISKGKAMYSFDDSQLVISFSHSPQYNRIKNDFVVWGIKENADGYKVPIRYHLAIDNKPQTGNIYEVFFYQDPADGLTKAKCPIKYMNFAHFPSTGVDGIFYLDENTGIIYKWDSELNAYVSLDNGPYLQYNSVSDFPSIGEFNYVYWSTSNGTQWIWGLDTNSTHYRHIQAELIALQADYEDNIRPYNTQIQTKQNTINTIQSDINGLISGSILLRNKKQLLEKQINDLEETKVIINNEITRVTGLKNEQLEIVTTQEELIATLTAEWEVETDPVRKAELEQEIEDATLIKNAAQQRANNYQEDIDLLEERVNELEEDIELLEEELIPVEEELAPIDAEIEQDGAEIAVIQNEINIIQEEIDNLTITYEEDKNDLLAQQYEYLPYTNTPVVKVQATDWRSELYLEGVAAEALGLESNYYYAELAAEWPKLYNLMADYYIDDVSGDLIFVGDFYKEVKDNPWDVNYWLDFIDSDTVIDQFSVKNIGRRSITKNSDDYNCVFESEVPDIVIIKNDETAEEQAQWCEERNQDYCIVEPTIYEMIVIGGLHNSCFNEIKNLLWAHTNYNSNINITTIPIYHLEPNTRISVTSEQDDIHGDFMMSTFSIPLSISGNMTIAATQVETKL